MAKRVTLTVNVDRALAERFREFVAAYNNKVGMCVSAALLLYLRAPEKVRTDLHRELFDSQFGEGIEALLKDVRPPSPGSAASTKKSGK